MSTSQCNDDSVLAAWGIDAIVTRRTPAMGTLNRTLLIGTVHGRYALRAYRHTERAPIEREHAIIAYARARGIPAVTPLLLLNGDTLLEHDGSFYALFPHASGQQFARGTLTFSEIAAVGRCLAQLHIALRGYSPERMACRSFAVDPATTLGGIEYLETLIRTRAHLDDTDQRALAQLAARRILLARYTCTTTDGFAQLRAFVTENNAAAMAERWCNI